MVGDIKIQNRPIVSSAFSEFSLTSVRIKEGTNDKFYGLVCFSKIQAQIFRLVVFLMCFKTLFLSIDKAKLFYEANFCLPKVIKQIKNGNGVLNSKVGD